MNQFHGDRIYVKNLPITTELNEIFNKEMEEYGLPGGWKFLCFKRKYYILETLR
jgi:hypothetical protein